MHHHSQLQQPLSESRMCPKEIVTQNLKMLQLWSQWLEITCMCLKRSWWIQTTVHPCSRKPQKESSVRIVKTVFDGILVDWGLPVSLRIPKLFLESLHPCVSGSYHTEAILEYQQTTTASIRFFSWQALLQTRARLGQTALCCGWLTVLITEAAEDKRGRYAFSSEFRFNMMFPSTFLWPMEAK